VQLVSEIDLQEYSLDVTAERMTNANVNEIIFLCQQARPLFCVSLLAASLCIVGSTEHHTSVLRTGH
jgi:hypothetical protein